MIPRLLTRLRIWEARWSERLECLLGTHTVILAVRRNLSGQTRIQTECKHCEIDLGDRRVWVMPGGRRS